MGIVTGIINQGEKLYTKSGCRLISKKTDLPLNSMDAAMIKDAVKSSVVVVETAFGKGKTVIKSYFDKDSKLLKRNINKSLGNKLEESDIKYSGNFFTGRTREKSRNVNGKYSHEYSQFKLKGVGNILGRKTHLWESKPSGYDYTETQVLEELAPHGKRNFIKTLAQYDSREGNIKSINITGNVASQQELNELLKSPYMHCITYENSKFLHEIKGYAKKQQNVENLDVSVYDVKLNGNTFGRCHYDDKYVEVDVSKHDSKAEIVDTINHEFRHVFQHFIVEKQTHPLMALLKDSIEMKKHALSQGFFKRSLQDLWIIKNKVDYKMIKEDIRASKKWAKEFKSYKKAEDNFDAYYEQEVERDARKAGKKAKKEFTDLMNKINNYFDNSRVNLYNWSEEKKRTYLSIQNKLQSLFGEL